KDRIKNSILSCFSARNCIVESFSVSQSPPELRISSGNNATLQCNFSTTDRNPYLFWYRQYPSHGQVKYLFRRSAGSEHNGAGSRFSLDFRKPETYVGLRMAELERSDSAMYFCAIAERVLGYHIGWVNRGAFTKSSDQFPLDSEQNWRR
uniref:Ig-like domain-containing protein n=1 Tax=Chrysemys picta bellii TaxID=8478 RepID=A0A8C3ICR3_CHRPI